MAFLVIFDRYFELDLIYREIGGSNKNLNKILHNSWELAFTRQLND